MQSPADPSHVPPAHQQQQQQQQQQQVPAMQQVIPVQQQQQPQPPPAVVAYPHLSAMPPPPTFASLGGGAHTGRPAFQSGPIQQLLPSLIPQHAHTFAPHLQYAAAAGAAVPPQQAEKKTVQKKEDANFGLVLPLQKVKRLIKSENSVKAVSGEASYAIGRATELLLEELLRRAHPRLLSDNRDTLEYEDISAVVNQWTATDFLKDIVQERVPLTELIQRARLQIAAEGGSQQAQVQPPPQQAQAQMQQIAPPVVNGDVVMRDAPSQQVA